jgi:hypothetical protein
MTSFIRRCFVSGAALACAIGAGAVVSAPAGAVQPAGPRAGVTFETAVPGIAPRGAAETAVYLDTAGRVMAGKAGPGGSAAEKPGAVAPALIGCTPESGRDNPHRSGTGVAVSGHGWWKKGTCDNNRARVFNCLYEWYTDNSWRQKACSETRELRPYTGSGDRTVARHDCHSTARTSWRNHVEVDVIGEIDTGEKPYRQADVDCRVN